MLTAKQIEQLRRAKPSGRNRVERAMDMAELTQNELADALHVTQAYISKIANSRYEDLPLETARAVADVFGCAIEDLFPAKAAIAS
jgi:DNA-binding XRE family transcriptional regulator